MCNCCAGRNRPERAGSAARPETSRHGNVHASPYRTSCPKSRATSLCRTTKALPCVRMGDRSRRSWCRGRRASDCSRPAIIRGRGAGGDDHRFQVRAKAPFGDSRNAGSPKHGASSAATRHRYNPSNGLSLAVTSADGALAASRARRAAQSALFTWSANTRQPPCESGAGLPDNEPSQGLFVRGRGLLRARPVRQGEGYPEPGPRGGFCSGGACVAHARLSTAAWAHLARFSAPQRESALKFGRFFGFHAQCVGEFDGFESPGAATDETDERLQ